MRHVRTWIRPESPQEAQAELRARGPRAAYLGGGTLLAEQDDPDLETLVDLAGLGLERIDTVPAGLQVGAMTTLEDLRLHPEAALLGSGILAEALGRTRIEAWRNQATLGGRLRQACAADPVLTALLVLDAHVHVLRDPERAAETLPIEEVTQLDPTHLILGVEIPSSVGWSHAMETVAQSAQDLPMLMLSAGALLLDGRIRAARVARSGSNTPPERLHKVEAELSGAEVDGSILPRCQQALAAEASPRADGRAGAAYREHLCDVLLGRVLRRVLASTATGT